RAPNPPFGRVDARPGLGPLFRLSPGTGRPHGLSRGRQGPDPAASWRDPGWRWVPVAGHRPGGHGISAPCGPPPHGDYGRLSDSGHRWRLRSLPAPALRFPGVRLRLAPQLAGTHGRPGCEPVLSAGVREAPSTLRVLP